MKTLFFGIVFVLLIIPPSGTAWPMVTGECSNCHTMHYSQGGSQLPQWGASGPYKNLTINDCVGCHSAADGTTWKDSTTGAPVVYNTAEPTYNAEKGLAAGNFYWVTQDDANGHNIFSDDLNLNQAPGDSAGCVNDSCHYNFDKPFSGSGHLNGRAGCQGCHMVSGSLTPSITTWHHGNDATDAVVDNNPAGQGWYRFLSGHRAGDGHGVSGIEDDDWQKSASSSDHNEYLGDNIGNKTDDMQGLKLLGNVMTGFCVGCHGVFHVQDTTSTGASPWIRHPSDAPIPNSGEYAAFTTYDPLVPVARPSLSGWTVPSGTVNPGTDLVMCLSCHRAHGSPYYKMMRWDYKNWPPGTNGCNVCHTSKN